MMLRHRYTETATPLVAEWTTVSELARNRRIAWTRLAERSLDVNPFYELPYLLASAKLEETDIRCVAIYRDGAFDSDLVGLFPLSRARILDGALLPALEFYQNKYFCLTTPLVDRDMAQAVWADFIDCLARAPATPGIVLSRLSPLDNATFRALETELAARNLACRPFDVFQRPMLYKPDRFQTAFGAITAKRRKDLQRRRRRMRADGESSIAVLRGPDITASAIEAFLDLEASGWKGKSGTALKSRPETRAFANEFLSMPNAELVVLSFKGKPIAIEANLVSRGVIHTVKTSYDEEFANYAPGLLLGIHTMRRISDDPRLIAADSCTAANHVISSIWKDRCWFGQTAFAVSPRVAPERIAQMVTLMTSFRRLRGFVRDIVRP